MWDADRHPVQMNIHQQPIYSQILCSCKDFVIYSIVHKFLSTSTVNPSTIKIYIHSSIYIVLRILSHSGFKSSAPIPISPHILSPFHLLDASPLSSFLTATTLNTKSQSPLQTLQFSFIKRYSIIRYTR